MLRKLAGLLISAVCHSSYLEISRRSSARTPSRGPSGTDRASSRQQPAPLSRTHWPNEGLCEGLRHRVEYVRVRGVLPQYSLGPLVPAPYISVAVRSSSVRAGQSRSGMGDAGGHWLAEAVVDFLRGPLYIHPLMAFIDEK